MFTCCVELQSKGNLDVRFQAEFIARIAYKEMRLRCMLRQGQNVLED